MTSPSEVGLPASQLSLAWLLRRSPVILPIPGTSSVEHLEENCGAAAVRLDDETWLTRASAEASVVVVG